MVEPPTRHGVLITFRRPVALADHLERLAAQTARGAADLLLSGRGHPESEIDRVTTPRGCTIAGLNELEHQGFSSAMIRGILTSARRADELG